MVTDSLLLRTDVHFGSHFVSRCTERRVNVVGLFRNAMTADWPNAEGSHWLGES